MSTLWPERWSDRSADLGQRVSVPAESFGWPKTGEIGRIRISQRLWPKGLQTGRTIVKIAYFDCFSGAAGDMILASLIDAGAELDRIRSQLASLDLKGYELRTQKVRRGLIQGLLLEVSVTSAEQPHRNLSDIQKLLSTSGLDGQVKSMAEEIFRRLAQVEAQVHGTYIQKVHFHEVGAVDSIVDIVGSCIALNLLGIEKVYCSELAVGSGTVRCAHGELPVPAPATAQLLLGVPTRVGYPGHELTTPTGAAILTSLAESFGPAPAMRAEQLGYGAGTSDFPDRPNVLRVVIGQDATSEGMDAEADEVWLVETNLDDAPGEMIGPLYDALLARGALDVYVTPIQMKKNRPGMLISVLVGPENLGEIETVLFEHTPTFGLRRHRCQRAKLSRRMVDVQTSYGSIRVKVGSRGGRELTVSPEFEDCRAAAEKHSVAQRQVYNEALACYRQDNKSAS